MKKTLFSLLICLTLCMGFALPASGAASDDIDILVRGLFEQQLKAHQAQNMQDYLDTHLAQTAGNGAEWFVLTLCQSGQYDFSAYRNQLTVYLKNNSVASASTRLKYALALLASGDDEHPYIASTMADAPGKQGIMSIVYALHLMNNGCQSPVMTQQEAVDTLLSLQLQDGGWAISGSVSDVDVTAMTLQALSSHQTQEDVSKAIQQALSLLSSRQMADGGYASYGVPNPESAAQVWIALSALNIDALSDSRFIQNGHTVLDAILSYQLEDGQFSHTAGGKGNPNTTVQALHALIAYQRMLSGLSPLMILDKQTPQETAFSFSSLGYKRIAALIVLCLAAISCITLLLIKKRSPKNYLAILLCALALILLIFLTDIQTAETYYQAAPAKQQVIGQVTLSIRCDTVIDQSSADYIPKDGVILPPTILDIAAGDTVYTVLTDAARAHHIQLESSGPSGMVYLSGIAHLYELAFGDLSGWVYYVNGSSPSVSCDQYTLTPGDTVLWQYTCQMGNDL